MRKCLKIDYLITKEMFDKLDLFQKLVALVLEEKKKLILVNENGDRIRITNLLQEVNL